MELSKEELQFIRDMMVAFPIQGTLRTLPQVMAKMAAMVQKLDGMIAEREVLETPPESSVPG